MSHGRPKPPDPNAPKRRGPPIWLIVIMVILAHFVVVLGPTIYHQNHWVNCSPQ